MTRRYTRTAAVDPDFSEKTAAMSHAVCMGWDAFRLCLGLTPRKFNRKQVIAWIANLEDTE